jgi:hypothetical protein
MPGQLGRACTHNQFAAGHTLLLIALRPRACSAAMLPPSPGGLLRHFAHPVSCPHACQVKGQAIGEVFLHLQASKQQMCQHRVSAQGGLLDSQQLQGMSARLSWDTVHPAIVLTPLSPQRLARLCMPAQVDTVLAPLKSDEYSSCCSQTWTRDKEHASAPHAKRLCSLRPSFH